MKKALKYLLVSSLLAAALASAPSLYAADSKTKTADKTAVKAAVKGDTEKVKATRDWYPFYGYVTSIDKQANTIALKKKEGERVLKLDTNSKIEINGQPAMLGSVKVGDYAHGTLHKDDAGKEVIRAAKFDKEAPAKEKQAGEKAPQETPASKSKR